RRLWRRRFRSGLLLHCRGICATIPLRREREGEKLTAEKKRHGTPDREPSEISPEATCQSLRPVRRDDLHAGGVRISQPAPPATSLGMRSLRLQVRDIGFISRALISGHQ